MEGSTRDSDSTARTAWKKAGAAPAEAFGNLDAHDAEREKLVDERAGNLRVLVHLTDELPDLAIGEFIHTVANQTFFF